MSRNPLINAADAAGDGFATTENGILRVPGESPTTYQWQRYVERLELEVEQKGLGHVLRQTDGPEHDKVPPHINVDADLPVLVAGEGVIGVQLTRSTRCFTAAKSQRAPPSTLSPTVAAAAGASIPRT